MIYVLISSSIILQYKPHFFTPSPQVNSDHHFFSTLSDFSHMSYQNDEARQYYPNSFPTLTPHPVPLRPRGPPLNPSHRMGLPNLRTLPRRLPRRIPDFPYRLLYPRPHPHSQRHQSPLPKVPPRLPLGPRLRHRHPHLLPLPRRRAPAPRLDISLLQPVPSPSIDDLLVRLDRRAEAALRTYRLGRLEPAPNRLFRHHDRGPEDRGRELQGHLGQISALEARGVVVFER